MGVLNFIKKWLAEPAPASLRPLEFPDPSGFADDDSIFRYPVRKVARTLRYRNLNDLIGRKVTVQSRESADSDFLAVVGDYVDQDRSERPLIYIGGAAHGRYGFLDLHVRGKPELLNEAAESGLALLLSLGFIRREEDGTFLCPDDFEQMANDIEERQVHLRLIMVDEGFDPKLLAPPPDGPPTPRKYYTPQFPVHFWIADACVSNSAYVWRWKHWYY